MRSESGINALQSLNTSGVHALRCCGVPCDHAGAAKLEVRAKVAMAMRLLSSIVLSPDLIVVPRQVSRHGPANPACFVQLGHYDYLVNTVHASLMSSRVAECSGDLRQRLLSRNKTKSRLYVPKT